ncbi:hypothetical protein [Methanobrevibacter sp.]|uniref:hypothetical protein n=1 Tax=Methanobrevibacter sp. TaxID=66852 RepID=UPI0038685A6D
MIGTITIVILFILIVSVCCCSDSSSTSNSSTAPKRTVNTNYRSNNNYHSYPSYCECPSCGAPYYDGYCEECGYPDINQGWLGEEY